jgi:predicted dinucleotide-binding enzyme
MKIGIVEAGMIGATAARLFAEAGHDVYMPSTPNLQLPTPEAIQSNEWVKYAAKLIALGVGNWELGVDAFLRSL